MNRLGPVFWQAVGYPGPYAGHGPMIPFIWAAHGSSNLDMGRYVRPDDASQCLLSMRLLFEKYLSDDKLKAGNGDILPRMNVVVERFADRDYVNGRVVAKLDIQRDSGYATAELHTDNEVDLPLDRVSLAPHEGAWEFFVRIFAHL